MKRILAAALIASSQAAYAESPSLTGTYSGIVACDRTHDGLPGVFQLNLDIRILQDGSDLYIATWTQEDEELQRKQASLYTGKASVAGEQVSGFASACRPDFDYQELVRILPATADGADLSFSAHTIFVTNALPNREGELITESCRWVMTRKSAEPPEMETCGAN